jgi:nucleotide-binding universal stress UspA family protein
LRALVYVDPSPRGEWALAAAALLPGFAGSELTLLATSEDAAAHPGLLERAERRLPGAASVSALREPGPAERAVTEHCRRARYDFVVVPPAGRNALQRMLRGSRVAAVVRRVRAPVLVARRPPPRFERILGAVSGGAASEAVCRGAAVLASQAGAAPAFVHVDALVSLPRLGHAGKLATDTPPAPRSPAEVVPAAFRERGTLIRREGLVVDEVLDEFEAGAHQLLVIGGAGQRSVEPLGEEDVTERLLLKCPGSVLVVPP